jgi:phosphatidylserine/phosphatidylglycerophosphate/cardiolipin synthase-like enzyme
MNHLQDPDRAIRRAGDAPKIPGNTVTLLRDGPAVFASWLADIARARRFILFENYIFRSDRMATRSPKR